MIIHLAEGGSGPIDAVAANRAIAWLLLLEAHAKRLYNTATSQATRTSSALAKVIKAKKLRDGFTRSDVLTKEWANLRTAEDVNLALTVLKDLNWLMSIENRQTGGRPAEYFHINPKLYNQE